MFPPFPESEARLHCLALMRALDEKKRIDFDKPPSEQNPKLSTKSLFEENSLGQMFGVCVCKDQDGRKVVLKAFSGQFNSIWNVEGWVPPLLDENAFYALTKDSDKKIHELTDEIERLKGEIAEAERAAPRTNGERLALKELRKTCIRLQKERRGLSRSSMAEIFALYRLHCADGAVKTFEDIFSGGKQPPTGCGECCAPKLLNHAFSRALVPLSLAEFYYGNEPPSGAKRHKRFYPPCDEKCAPILPAMLGLHIVYRDGDIAVVNKPSGLLSVPGRGEGKSDCVTSRLKRLFPGCIEQPSVHRLDMDTSGLLVLAFNERAHRNLSAQFMNGSVRKRYVAFLRGSVSCGEGCFLYRGSPDFCGRIELKFRLDIENRPRQICDDEHGKTGVTDWRVIPRENEARYLKAFSMSEGQEKALLENPHTCVEFMPHTGRTHQLRLHSAHEKGLGCAIIGDNLYGEQRANERLMLHACEIAFTHPSTNAEMRFTAL